MIAAKAGLTRIENDRRYEYKMYGLSDTYQRLTEKRDQQLEKFNAAKSAWEKAADNE